MSTAVEPAWATDEAAVRGLLRKGTDELERVRAAWLKWYLFTWTCLLVLLPVTAGLHALMPNVPAVWGVVGGASLVTVIVMGSISAARGKQLHELFDKWREQVVVALDAAAKCEANSYVASGSFDASGLNTAPYNDYSGSNYLSVGGMRASNLAVNNIYTRTWTETVSSTDAQGRTTYQTVQRSQTVVDPVFHGIMLIVPAPLPHSGTVVLTGKGALAGLREITVMSPQLKKHYQIGASDPHVGHRVLTPSLQAALWDYGQDYRYLVRFAYRGGLLYITIPGATLTLGKRPNKWLTVSEARLMRIVEACRGSINFMHDSAEKLSPELD